MANQMHVVLIQDDVGDRSGIAEVLRYDSTALYCALRCFFFCEIIMAKSHRRMRSISVRQLLPFCTNCQFICKVETTCLECKRYVIFRHTFTVVAYFSWRCIILLILCTCIVMKVMSYCRYPLPVFYEIWVSGISKNTT